jgi:hypothetical protein
LIIAPFRTVSFSISACAVEDYGNLYCTLTRRVDGPPPSSVRCLGVWRPDSGGGERDDTPLGELDGVSVMHRVRRHQREDP